MMILMMKMGDRILWHSVRIYIDDCVCIYVETFRPKKDLIYGQCKSV